jgi:hypothetical protein
VSYSPLQSPERSRLTFGDSPWKEIAGFFSFDPMKRTAQGDSDNEDNWKSFRNRGEYSHGLRAVLAAIRLIALIIAIAINGTP